MPRRGGRRNPSQELKQTIEDRREETAETACIQESDVGMKESRRREGIHTSPCGICVAVVALGGEEMDPDLVRHGSPPAGRVLGERREGRRDVEVEGGGRGGG